MFVPIISYGKASFDIGLQAILVYKVASGMDYVCKTRFHSQLRDAVLGAVSDGFNKGFS